MFQSVSSKPKVHRLPSVSRRGSERRLMHALLNYGSTTRFVFVLSGLTVAMVFSVLMVSRMIPMSQNGAADHEFVQASLSDAMASTVPDSYGKTIVLRDRNNVIIGQMSKDQPQDGADVKTSSSIKN